MQRYKAHDHPCPRGWLVELWDIKRQLALEAPAEPDADLVHELAAIICEVDGSNCLGAAALAEAILSHPRIGSTGLTMQPMALQWSENFPPCKEFRCECIATTPFGRFLIELKSFSGGICPIIMEVPWKDSINVKRGINPESLVGFAFWSLADAKEACQAEFNKRLLSCCAATAKQEPNNEAL